MFDPFVAKIPWKRARLPTPVFGLENSMDCIELETTERLSLHQIHMLKLDTPDDMRRQGL